MAQVLVKGTPSDFHYTLSTNSIRRDQVLRCCSSSADVQAAMASEFWRRNPAKDRLNADTTPHQDRLSRFYNLHCHIRLATDCNDKQGGFVVLSGELLGLHNIKPGTGDWMLREAVALGADRLDTFDIPNLINLYTRHGFVEVLREPNRRPGQPDVVWMRRHG